MNDPPQKTPRPRRRSPSRFSRFLRDYGMLGVLILLGVLFSILTLRDQPSTGSTAARALARSLAGYDPATCGVLIVCQQSREDSAFVRSLEKHLASRRLPLLDTIRGDPAEVRSRLAHLSDSFPPTKTMVMATTAAAAPTVASIVAALPAPVAPRGEIRVLVPPSYRWPTFLLAENLRNVANQITVIAIIAIGMTMVIISGGIDLSVGSLIALSAVVTAWSVSRAGGDTASAGTLLLASLGGILLCGVTGAFSGLMITRFRIPPFIATLAMMQVAAGIAYIVSHGMPIYQLPSSSTWLGRGVDPLLKIPIAVLLMLLLYVIAHVVMTRTTLGRCIYAVGGNMEAARLAGIRVHAVLFLVYTLCGMSAGLGGVLMASQLKSGAPTYGVTYELYVIAAVVVGGASLSGGEGRIFGTLIGALVIAVIQNGMNLTNVESYTQKVVLGLVILGAVLLDRLKQQGLHRRSTAGKSR